ncbi:hypothetical protein [Clostridium beijerinckii]|uniref:hypothetical protein n=1 Tax=Clostridium beijerinckii TaxID=1520 RepID=UPI001F4C3295|nr:hypothetical protein [Clostridium beijerinckii]NSA90971.1 hypothetical protein [Clostridium beijerinckii]
MEVVLEQFIPSDKSKRISNILQKISIVFFVVGLMIVFASPIIGIALIIVALIFLWEVTLCILIMSMSYIMVI